jgi:hypothetical protein
MSCTTTILDFRAKKTPIYKELGDTLSFTLTFTDSATAAIDMSGILAAVFNINGVDVAELGDGITVVGTDDNIIKISKDITEVVGKFDYYFTLTLADGTVKKYLDGKITIE